MTRYALHLLTLLALVAASLTMISGQARAMAPEAMAVAGHCAGMAATHDDNGSRTGDQNKRRVMNCMLACAALPGSVQQIAHQTMPGRIILQAGRSARLGSPAMPVDPPPPRLA